MVLFNLINTAYLVTFHCYYKARVDGPLLFLLYSYITPQ